MNPIGFGRRVTVTALTMRVVAYRDDGTARFKIPQANDVPWFDPVAVDDWPGDPVSLDWDLPKGPRFVLEPDLNGKAVVRYRRLTLDHPQDGLVIGTCWRQEGVLVDKTMAGPRRTISLYEVALQPPLRTSRALVVLAHPRDLRLVDQVPAAVPAPTRVGVGGRLGGGRA